MGVAKELKALLVALTELVEEALDLLQELRAEEAADKKAVRGYGGRGVKR